MKHDKKSTQPAFPVFFAKIHRLSLYACLSLTTCKSAPVAGFVQLQAINHNGGNYFRRTTGTTKTTGGPPPSLLLQGNSNNNAAVHFSKKTQTRQFQQLSIRYAKPKRLEENAEGVLYVNDRCINCSACSQFAPSTFKRSTSSSHHIVYHQETTTAQELQNARAALAACPVSAIRTLTSAELSHASGGKERLTPQQEEMARSFALSPKANGLDLPFPRRVLLSDEKDEEEEGEGMWFLGHHNEASFGATPYLVRGRGNHDDDSAGKKKFVSIMVDVPKCTPSAIRTVKSLLPPPENNGNTDGDDNDEGDGPDYMFLTHIDDTASHQEWKKVFPKMKRIFHAGDLGRFNWIGDESLEDVEILLHGASRVEEGELMGWSLDGVPVKINYKQQERGADLSALASTLVNNEEDGNVPGKKDSSIENGVDLGDFLIVHTPGHSPGSISLLYHPARGDDGDGNVDDTRKASTLFTGDTYAYTTRGNGHMTGFPQYAKENRSKQAETLKCLGRISSWWDSVAAGHGHIRDYTSLDGSGEEGKRAKEMMKQSDIKDAVEELMSYN